VVGAVLVGVLEGVFRGYGAGGHDFKGDPGSGDIFHNGDDFVGIFAPVAGYLGGDALDLVLTGGGRIIVVMQGLDIKIGIDLMFFTGFDGAEVVGADACGDFKIAYEIDGAFN